jgi:hypothetical protein
MERLVPQELRLVEDVELEVQGLENGRRERDEQQQSEDRLDHRLSPLAAGAAPR